MRRRTFAKSIGAGIAGLGLTSTVSARSEGELPNENVEFTNVHPFAPAEDPVTVPAGDWIRHIVGWVDDGEQRRVDVEAYLDAVEMRVWIDGDEIENPDQYWGDIVYQDRTAEDEEPAYKYFVWWTYDTPPKDPGSHTFTVEFAFPDGLDAGESTRPVGFSRTFEGHYEVRPGRTQ